jgi:hypothetical protein
LSKDIWTFLSSLGENRLFSNLPENEVAVHAGAGERNWHLGEASEKND